MTPRPLPRTIPPEPDELLSSWLRRLAAVNLSDSGELLDHLGLGAVTPDTLDMRLDRAAARALAAAARLDIAPLERMTLSGFAGLTAMRDPFQSCRPCETEGVSLRHWRRAWSVDCERCGAALRPAFADLRQDRPSARLVRRARLGAAALLRAALFRDGKELRRAWRAVAFAQHLHNFSGPAEGLLLSKDASARLTALAAIHVAQTAPIAKAGWIVTHARHATRLRLEAAYRDRGPLIRVVRRRMRPAIPALDRSVRELGVPASCDPSGATSRGDTRPCLYRRAAELAIDQRTPGETHKRTRRRAQQILQQLRQQDIAINSATQASESQN